MSTGRTIVAVLSLAILAPLSFCVALPMGINELKAMNWGSQYAGRSHPPRTQRIWLRQGVEKLSNGDNCDFLLLEARSYAPGDEVAIRAFYGQQVEFFQERPARMGVDVFDDFYAEVARLHEGPFYTVEVWEVVESAPPLVDWRCP